VDPEVVVVAAVPTRAPLGLVALVVRAALTVAVVVAVAIQEVERAALTAPAAMAAPAYLF
jgi:hypothetical protein